MRTLLFGVLFLFFFSAEASVSILNGLTHVHTGVAGETMYGKVVLKNNSKGASRVIIYRQDLLAKCGDEGIMYLDKSESPNSLAKWLSIAVDEKVLQPYETYELTYKIKVPSSFDNGSYWQVIMIEGADPVSEQGSQGFVVSSKVRYAVQVVANLGAYESPTIAYEDVSLINSEGAKVNVRLKNEGMFSTNVKLGLELYDNEGIKVKTIEGLSRRLYPKSCNFFTIDVSSLPKGKYVGLLIADTGSDLFGSNLTMQL